MSTCDALVWDWVTKMVVKRMEPMLLARLELAHWVCPMGDEWKKHWWWEPW